MGIVEWTIVGTPDSTPYSIKEILNPFNAGISITKFEVAQDGSTMWAIVRRGDRNGLNHGGAQSALYKSVTSGISWDDSAYINLSRAQSTIDNGTLIWDISIARDDSKFIAVVCSDIKRNPLEQEIWISTDLGIQWLKLDWVSSKIDYGPIDYISSLCISNLMNNRRYLLVGTRDGTGTKTNNINIIDVQYDQRSRNFSKSTVIKISNNPIRGDILAAKFSPLFEYDRSIIAVYVSGDKKHEGTWLAMAKLDLENGKERLQLLCVDRELCDSTNMTGASPKVNEIVRANLELPSNFSTDNLDGSYIYVCTDAVGVKSGCKPDIGLYRITSDQIVEIFYKQITESDRDSGIHICSISYSGTCQSGKLMVGESFGKVNLASISTWFSHNPGSNQVFWDKSNKSPTGAAKIQSESTRDKIFGFGNAQVKLGLIGPAFVATGAASIGPWAEPEINADNAILESISWPAGLFNVVPNDESAISISRNNGVTWNQISLINTKIAKLTDVAPSLDCTTVYLASVSNLDCIGFASIWRTTINPSVASPLPAVPPTGTTWERVFIYNPHSEKAGTQTRYPIIRVTEEKIDGESVACSFQGSKFLFWSPDYGDIWVPIQITSFVQDFTFASSVIIYLLSPRGIVERIVHNGIGWKNVRATCTNIGSTHSIATVDENRILVGADEDSTFHSVAYSGDGGLTWVLIADQIPDKGNIHVAFDPNYKTNGFIYAACDSKRGSIFRNTYPSFINWLSTDLLSSVLQTESTTMGKISNVGGKFGLAIAKTGEPESALYVAQCNTSSGESCVLRTLNRLAGLPSPGISWDSLDIYSPLRQHGARFSLEPSSLKIAGCQTRDTNSTIYAIDDDFYAGNHNVKNGLGNMKSNGERGMLWAYTDCIAKMGPRLIMNDNVVIDCEPLTYMNKAIFFTWEQLCLSTKYELQIAKDPDFNLIIVDISNFSPTSYSSPAIAYFVGNNMTHPTTIKVPGLEPETTYYWRCRVICSANGANVRSPWSEIRKFYINMKSGGTPSVVTTTVENLDKEFMRLAIEEAKKSTSEDDRIHPKVGVVIVKDNKVLTSAHRGELASGDHAEFTAFEKKLRDETLAGATVYTTLEPCTTRNHPKIPCANRIIERKVARVVIGMLDPNPKITGKGQILLREANIVTEFFTYDLMAEVEELNRDFIRFNKHNRDS